MSSKRKTSAPTRVLVNDDKVITCPPDVTTDTPDYDSDQSHDRSLRVVTSPSSLSADDDDDVTPTSRAGTQRRWLCAEVASVVRKMMSVIAAARTLEDKRRRVDEMLAELETIRGHLLTVQSDISSTPIQTPLCDVSFTMFTHNSFA